jgi:biopolymer transport protein ExbD
MRTGMSVELPATRNAVLLPDIDNKDSLVVTLTDDGSLYVGVEPIGPVELAQQLKSAVAGHPEERLYVKADARAPYSDLIRILDSVRSAGIERFTLLTTQREAEQPGALVPPKGFELLIMPPPPRSSPTWK